MSTISIIMPGMTPRPHEKISNLFRDVFQVNSSEDIEYYEMVPISSDKIETCQNLAVKFKSSDLNLINLECLLHENHSLQIHLEKSKETIKTLSYEYTKVFSNSSVSKDIDHQKALKKAKKIKQLDEDNKKLRQLLKAQLENSEKLRLETQTTVETLREEFELLVKELGNLQRKSSDPHGGRHSLGMAGTLTSAPERKASELLSKIDTVQADRTAAELNSHTTQH